MSVLKMLSDVMEEWLADQKEVKPKTGLNIRYCKYCGGSTRSMGGAPFECISANCDGNGR